MVVRTEDEIIQAMNSINWDFDDYSSAKYPLDMNSIPWYPATFPAPIPKYLVALLSEQEDTVFDPFGGKGTTAVESLKQRRRFIYNDLNPHAVMITQCILDAVRKSRDEQTLEKIFQKDKEFLTEENRCFDNYCGKDRELAIHYLTTQYIKGLKKRSIKEDVIFWFHAETLKELVRLYDYIDSFKGFENGIRKLAFLSILKEVSSQRGHFSYITDNCRPNEMRYYNAIVSYLEMLDRIKYACMDFYRQYRVINKLDDLSRMSQQCLIHSGNAKDCGYIKDTSVDLVITSPPYLCAQDYILTMRLNDYFYPNQGFEELPFTEIGPRRLRTRSGIVKSYFEDMNTVIQEMHRVLKKDAYFCLIIGQGKGKVSKNIDISGHVINEALETGFSKIFKTTRNIRHKNNRNGGVDKEDLILFKK